MSPRIYFGILPVKLGSLIGKILKQVQNDTRVFIMAKKKNTPLNIFMESVGLYFSNFDKFVKYMTFPVLGQITGLSLVLAMVYFFTKNMPIVIWSSTVTHLVKTVLLTLCIQITQ